MNVDAQMQWQLLDSIDQTIADSCIFVGYIVCLRATTMFLVSLERFPRKWINQFGSGEIARSSRVFTSNPSGSKVFSDYDEALRTALEYDLDDPQVARLFDSDDQLLIAFDACADRVC